MNLGKAVLENQDSLGAGTGEKNNGGALGRLGDYELLEEIARGGMGAVYRARQISLKRMVAVKVLLAAEFANKTSVERFRREAQAAASLNHPNIVSIYEVNDRDGEPYFAMELVEGRNLAEVAREAPVPVRRAAEWIKTVAEAVQFAHEHGVLHRDLKPSNVLVDKFDVPHITDFGLAKRVEEDTDLTMTGQVLGTPNYMPPEQAEPKRGPTTAASDVYSLGAMLYHLVTGRAPFLSQTVQATLRQVLEQEPVSPRLLNIAVPRDLETIILKCLEKDPVRRYETAKGLAMDIQRHLSNEPIVARPQSSVYRFQKLVRRNKLAFAAGGAIAAALVIGLVGIFWQWRQAERNHQEAQANLYAADMNRAAQVLDDLGPVAGRALLERHTDQTQLHGFEWRYLWKRSLGDFAYSFPSRSNRVWKITFSPDGKTLAALEDGDGLRLLDLATRTETVALTNVTGLAGFTSDSQELILLQRDGNEKHLVRYEPKTRRFKVLSSSGTRLGWLPDLLADGRTAVLPVQRTELSLVDVRSGETTAHFNSAGSGFMRWQAVTEATAVSGDGRWVFSLENGAEEGTVCTLSIREMKTGKIVGTYDDAAPGTAKCTLSERMYFLRFLPDDRTVLWANRDGFLRSWRWTEPSSVPLIVRGHRGVIWEITCSPDGRRLATAGDDQTIRLWDAQDLRELRVLRGHDDAVYTIAFSPDSRWLASAGEGGTIKLWDLKSAGSSGEVPLLVGRELANRISFTPDGRSMAIGTDDNCVRVFDIKSWEVTASFKDFYVPATFMADGTRIIGFGGVGNLATGKVEQAIDLSDLGYPWALDVSPDGRLLARTFRSLKDRSDSFELRDLQQGTVITNFVAHHFPVALRFTEGGQTLLASQSDETLVWWKVNPLDPIPGRTVQVGHFSRAMVLSPDGRTVALGGISRISLVDYRTGAIFQRLFGHAHEITGLAFSPDGRTLASCSMDGTIKLWNLQTMQEVCTITFDVKPAPGKEIGVQGVGFAPDGNSLWAFSRSGILKYWRAATSDEIAAAGQPHRP
jgi:WD40 repeat protein/tRNA A-37 threonylcarbamoyl transferase component Bud32